MKTIKCTHGRTCIKALIKSIFFSGLIGITTIDNANASSYYTNGWFPSELIQPGNNEPVAPQIQENHANNENENIRAEGIGVPNEHEALPILLEDNRDEIVTNDEPLKAPIQVQNEPVTHQPDVNSTFMNVDLLANLITSAIQETHKTTKAESKKDQIDAQTYEKAIFQNAQKQFVESLGTLNTMKQNTLNEFFNTIERYNALQNEQQQKLFWNDIVTKSIFGITLIAVVWIIAHA